MMSQLVRELALVFLAIIITAFATDDVLFLFHGQLTHGNPLTKSPRAQRQLVHIG